VSARAQSASASRGYRLRPAPRGSRKGSGGRVQWDRVGRIALLLVLAAILASYVKPALNFFDAWNDSKTEHSSLAELTKENQQLKNRMNLVEGPDAAERAARKLGMISTGEGSYVVRGLNR
jgi:cell division protein FtsB